MFSIYANSNKKAYGVKNFIIDSEDDVEILPTNCAPSSTAKIINGDLYVLGNDKQWKKETKAGSSGGSSIEYIEPQALTREELLEILI